MSATDGETWVRLALNPQPPYAFTEFVEVALDVGSDLKILEQLFDATAQAYLSDSGTNAVSIGRCASHCGRYKLMVEWRSGGGRMQFLASQKADVLDQGWQRSGVVYRSGTPVLFELPALIQERHTPFVPPIPGTYIENFMTLMITFVVWDNCWDVFRKALAQRHSAIVCGTAISGWTASPDTGKSFLVAVKVERPECATELMSDLDEEDEDFTWRWFWRAMRHMAVGGVSIEGVEMLAAFIK